MNNQRTFLLFFALMLFIPIIIVRAQTHGNENSFEVKLNSKVLNEERTLLVQLPLGYKEGKSKYPVLFLLDGRNHFQHGVAATDYLNRIGIIPNVIVVAITNTDRNKDFLPSKVERAPTGGGADNFLKFFEQELIPLINDRFKTSPYRILMGHSFGGTFTTYAFLKKPELFSAYIAVSPVVHFDNNLLLNIANKQQPGNYKHNKCFYYTVGNEPPYFDALEKWQQVLSEVPSEKFQYKYVKLPDENHATTPYLSLFTGLKFTFSDWQLPNEYFQRELREIDQFYAQLTDKYGYEIKTPEAIINRLGYQYLLSGNISKAITVFSENTKRYPGSANVYDSLGEAYEKDGQLKKAKENYEKAFTFAKLINHPNTQVFKNNLERVSK